MMIEPRIDFQRSPHKAAWHDFSATPTFAAAAQAAMVQMQIDLGNTTDVTNAGANGFKMIGAQKFLHTLMSLTETSEKPAATNSRANLRPT
jgi:hypothetical protein